MLGYIKLGMSPGERSGGDLWSDVCGDGSPLSIRGGVWERKVVGN